MFTKSDVYIAEMITFGLGCVVTAAYFLIHGYRKVLSLKAQLLADQTEIARYRRKRNSSGRFVK